MALRELPFRTAAAIAKEARPAIRVALPLCRRHASSAAVAEIESSSSLEVPAPPEELVKSYDPVARSRLRRRGNKELPPSRCEPSSTCTRAAAET
jgi:large subunit ribosomal protein L5